jgi:hypothetical protein
MDIDNIAVHLDLAALRKLIKRVQDDEQDDANDVRWWSKAFAVLKPPKKPTNDQSVN